MTELYAIFNDIHFPFEDKTRYQVARNILKDVCEQRGRPLDHLFLNGDIAEFLNFGAWPKSPDLRAMTSCHEVDYVNKKFDELQAEHPDVPVTFNEGNHCYRFFRYIRDLAPQMWGLIDCPLLLKFPDRPKWKFVPYTPLQLVKCGASNLYLRHEPIGRGANHAKSTAESSVVDIAYGHTHTWQTHSHKKFGPKPFIVRAYSCGWLGNKSSNVFDYRGARDNWVEGFTIVECDPETGAYTLEFIDLRVLPVLYRGKKYTAKKAA